MRYLTCVCWGIAMGLESAGFMYFAKKLPYAERGITDKTSFFIAGFIGGGLCMYNGNPNNIPAETVAYIVGLAAGNIAGNFVSNYLNPNDDYQISVAP